MSTPRRGHRGLRGLRGLRRCGAALACLASLAIAAGVSAAPPAAAPPAGHGPAAAAAPPAAAPGATYAVRLTRGFVVGQKLLVQGSLATDDRSSGGAKGAETSRHDNGTVRFVVVTEAVEVSARGNVQRSAITVRRLFKESAGIEAELAKPGDELRAYVSGRRRIVESRGAEMASDLMEALGAAAALRADDDPTDDDLFGTAERRAVGASWPVNADLFARFGAQQMLFEPKNVAGTATLAALQTVKGVPCLEVRWKLDARNGSFKPGSLPSGLFGTMSVMSISARTVVPIDPAQQPAVRETEIAGTGDFTGATDGGDPLTLHRLLRQTLHLEISKVP
jgi:hypothetical protein